MIVDCDKAIAPLHWPLRTVLGIARMLAASDELSELSREYVRHLQDAGRLLLDRHGDVLDLVRLRAGRLAMFREPVVLRPLLEEVVAHASTRCAGAPPCVHCPGSLTVYTDRIRLKQVLEALTETIAAAGPAGPIVFEAAAGPSAHEVSIRIAGPASYGSDGPLGSWMHGPDMSQWPAAARQRDLRACIGRELLARLGCALRIGSDERHGEHLCLVVPRADAEDAARSSRDAPSAGATRAMAVGPRVRRLLCIDADDSNLWLIKEALDPDRRLHLMLSPSARLGLEIAAATPPHAVLLDLDSTAIDALATRRDLRSLAHGPTVPIIVLTSDTSPRNIERIRAEGFFRYVEKPISAPELRRTVDAALSAGDILT